MTAIRFDRIRRLLLGSCLLGLSALPSQAATVFRQNGSCCSTVQYFTALPAPDTNAGSIYFVTPRNTANSPSPLVAFFDDGIRSGIRNWGVARADGRPPSSASYSVFTRAAASNVYVHQATPQNSVSNVTTLDNVWINGNPQALVWVTQNVHAGERPRAGARNPIVRYAPPPVGRWQIVNQGWNPYDVIVGESFNVIVEFSSYAGASYFVQTATPANTQLLPNQQTAVRIEHPALQQPLPNALIMVTPVANAACGWPASNLCDHPVGTTYNTRDNRWYINYTDFRNMTPGAAFNVWILTGGN